MTLEEGLQRMQSLIDGTVRTALPGYEAVPEKSNSDIRIARQLRNNHSLIDHSVSDASDPYDPEVFVQYDDCDSLKDLIHDGYVAGYGVSIAVESEPEANEMLRAVGEHWEKQGYKVESEFYSRQGNNRSPDLLVDAGYARYTAYLYEPDDVVYLRASSRCLPPSQG